MDVEVRPQTRPAPAQSTAEDFATWGPVHLDVTDAERSLAFWGGVIGLELLERSAETVSLGAEDAELVVLHPGARTPVRRGHSGLYHLAIHLPSEADFARVLGRLFQLRVPNSPTDHIMHWATYLDDPDGIGLELSFETLDRFSHYESGAGRPVIRDSQGRARGAVEPLDLEEVFSYLGDRDFEQPLPPGTRIGHVHLHVAATEPARDFYEAVGFHRNIDLPLMGMTDFHAGGSFKHRLAVNVWQGAGAPQPPPGTAGLRHLVLRLRSAAALEAAAQRIAPTTEPAPETGGILVSDPSGNRTLLVSDGSEGEL